jgi:hypothetical protein
LRSNSFTRLRVDHRSDAFRECRHLVTARAGQRVGLRDGDVEQQPKRGLAGTEPALVRPLAGTAGRLPAQHGMEALDVVSSREEGRPHQKDPVDSPKFRLQRHLSVGAVEPSAGELGRVARCEGVVGGGPQPHPYDGFFGRRYWPL